MPNESFTVLQKISEYGLLGYAWIVALSIWAGTARYLMYINDNEQKPTFIGWATENVISGFVGIVVALTCQYYSLDFFLTSALTAIGAHNGTRTLYLLTKIIRKRSV